MFVEFVGIPGSGKSIISDSLVKSLQESNGKNYLTCEEAFFEVAKGRLDHTYRKVLNVLPSKQALALSRKLKNRTIMQFDAQNRFLAKYCRSLIPYISSEEFSKMQYRDREMSLGYFLEVGAMYELLLDQSSRGVFVFFSEGFVQRSLMFQDAFHSQSPNFDRVYEYLSFAPRPGLLFHVKADPEICYERMLSRSKGVPRRLRGLSADKLINYLGDCERYLSALTGFLKKQYGVKSYEIENLSTVDRATSCALHCFWEYQKENIEYA